jgi:hypothetical protein
MRRRRRWCGCCHPSALSTRSLAPGRRGRRRGRRGTARHRRQDAGGGPNLGDRGGKQVPSPPLVGGPVKAGRMPWTCPDPPRSGRVPSAPRFLRDPGSARRGGDRRGAGRLGELSGRAGDGGEERGGDPGPPRSPPAGSSKGPGGAPRSGPHAVPKGSQGGRPRARDRQRVRRVPSRTRAVAGSPDVPSGGASVQCPVGVRPTHERGGAPEPPGRRARLEAGLKALTPIRNGSPPSVSRRLLR